MAEIIELAPVFRRAAEVIQTNGLYKGDFCDSTAAGERTAVCTVGALRVVAGGHPVAESALADEAVRFLSPRIYSNVVDEDPIERIADWNDSADRTPTEVVETLLSAAAAAEQVMAA